MKLLQILDHFTASVTYNLMLCCFTLLMLTCVLVNGHKWDLSKITVEEMLISCTAVVYTVTMKHLEAY